MPEDGFLLHPALGGCTVMGSWDNLWNLGYCSTSGQNPRSGALTPNRVLTFVLCWR